MTRRLPHIAFVAAWLLILGALAANASPRSSHVVSPFSPYYWTNSGNGNGRNGWAQDMLSAGPSEPLGVVSSGSVPHGPRRGAAPSYGPPSRVVTLREPAPPNACGPGRFEVVNRDPGEPLCVGNPAGALALGAARD